MRPPTVEESCEAQQIGSTVGPDELVRRAALRVLCVDTGGRDDRGPTGSDPAARRDVDAVLIHVRNAR